MSGIVDIKTREKGSFLVSIRGPIDTDTYIEVGTAIKPLLSGSTEVLIMDMGGVDYVSSVGIGVILRAKIYMEDKGGKFIMTDLQPHVETVFEIIKALPGIQIFKNIEEVDEYFTKIQNEEIEKNKR